MNSKREKKESVDKKVRVLWRLYHFFGRILG
jgi:hypothetical protein